MSEHQKKVIDFWLSSSKRIILADGWNMGKTVTSLACMHFAHNYKILIIVPEIKVHHWVWHVQQMKFITSIASMKNNDIRKSSLMGSLVI